MLAVPGQKLSLLGSKLHQQLAKTLHQINLKFLQLQINNRMGSHICTPDMER